MAKFRRKISNSRERRLEKVEQVITRLALMCWLPMAGFCLYAYVDFLDIQVKSQTPIEVITAKPDAANGYTFTNLRDLNSDVVGWIELTGTKIDFPVLKSDDNEYYLRRDYLRRYSISGSIFMDYRNNKNFADNVSVVYGHRMSKGQMFSDVGRYAEKDFFERYGSGYLTTADGKRHRLTVYAYAVVNADNSLYSVDLIKGFSPKALLSMVLPGVRWGRLDNIQDAARVIILSTCDTGSKNNRDILLIGLEN